MAESRDSSVLDDVRAALGHHETVKPTPLGLFDEPEIEVGDPTEKFIQEAIALGSKIYLVKEASEVALKIAEICKPHTEIVMAEATLLEELGIVPQLNRLGLTVRFASEFPGDDLISRLATAPVGVTGIECAIAETGTILVLGGEQHSLLVSLLPPIHIAVLRASQIKRNLTEVIEKLGVDMSGAMRSATFITGPSRTSDVELTLSIGVHGPKELHLIVMQD